MALTAMHRLLRRCGVSSAEVGVLHLGPTLLDRSKSMKTELMALVEANDGGTAEGVDACSSNAALLSCMRWAEGDSWDGRWAIAVCSSWMTLTVPTGMHCVVALLVGQSVSCGGRQWLADIHASLAVPHLKHMPVDVQDALTLNLAMLAERCVHKPAASVALRGHHESNHGRYGWTVRKSAMREIGRAHV